MAKGRPGERGKGEGKRKIARPRLFNLLTRNSVFCTVLFLLLRWLAAGASCYPTEKPQRPSHVPDRRAIPPIFRDVICITCRPALTHTRRGEKNGKQSTPTAYHKPPPALNIVGWIFTKEFPFPQTQSSLLSHHFREIVPVCRSYHET